MTGDRPPRDPTPRDRPPRDRERHRLAVFVTASAGFHLLLFLVPLAWWHAVPWLGGGGGERAGAARGAEVMTVSLMELPAFEPPAPDASPPVDPEPEVEPVDPEPEVPPLPLPVAEPSAEEPAARAEAGTGNSGRGAEGVEAAAGSGDPGARADGVPGPGEPEPRYLPPRLLAGALPLTPEESEDLNLDSPLEISVRLRVGEDGLVREVAPDTPDLPPRLVEALERSARAMRFVPARLGERPVEAWFSMTFVYRR